MTTPYCSKDEWAIKKGYASWSVYDKSYPTEADLDDYLEEMTDIMNSELYLNTTTNITDTRYVNLLRRICYNGANYMMDEEESRAQERSRTRQTYVDYMRPSHRQQLQNIAIAKGNILVGDVG